MRARLPAALLLALLSHAAATGSAAADPVAVLAPEVTLGRALFFDVNLSRDRTQSCASCHDPSRAFSDGRDNGVGGAVSLGGDGRSLGDRNAPTATYAALTPKPHRTADGHWVGGLFLDGRAVDLADQAGQPLVNPIEMAQPDVAAVVRRVLANPAYVTLLEKAFGPAAATDRARAFAGVRRSIAAFEQTRLFAPFDSKYDRYLRGEYVMTPVEELGRKLFFSPLINCRNCHLLRDSETARDEPFTSYGYHNIGLPANASVRAKNGLGPTYRDGGLGARPGHHDSRELGLFKVPTLRNVAITSPYMHNGIFHELRTAIRFYNRYLVDNEQARINPETGRPWGAPEFPDTIDLDLLQQGQPLDPARIDALVAFLRTLTDRRYESLLPDAGR